MIVIGDKFKCFSIQTLNALLMAGFQICGYDDNRLIPGHVVWYFPMTEELKKFLETHNHTEVEWIKK